MAWVAEDGKRQLISHPLWIDVCDKVWDTMALTFFYHNGQE